MRARRRVNDELVRRIIEVLALDFIARLGVEFFPDQLQLARLCVQPLQRCDLLLENSLIDPFGQTAMTAFRMPQDAQKLLGSSGQLTLVVWADFASCPATSGVKTLGPSTSSRYIPHHSHHVLRVRLQRLALLVGVVVLVIGPLQADLGVPEHGVADVLVEAQVRQPALAGYAKIVNTIFPEGRLGVA